MTKFRKVIEIAIFLIILFLISCVVFFSYESWKDCEESDGVMIKGFCVDKKVMK